MATLVYQSFLNTLSSATMRWFGILGEIKKSSQSLQLFLLHLRCPLQPHLKKLNQILRNSALGVKNDPSTLGKWLETLSICLHFFWVVLNLGQYTVGTLRMNDMFSKQLKPGPGFLALASDALMAPGVRLIE